MKQSSVLSGTRSVRAATSVLLVENAEIASPKPGEQGYAGKQSSLMTEYSVLFISADAGSAGKIQGLLRTDETLAVECMRVEALFDGLRAIQDKQFDLVLSEL